MIVRGNVLTGTASTTYPWDIDPGEPLPDLPAFRLRCRQAGVKDKVVVFLNRFTDNGGQSEGYEGGEFGFDFIPGSVQGTAYGNNIWFFDNFVRYNQGYTDHVCGEVGIETQLSQIDSALVLGKLDTFYTEPQIWSLKLRLMDKLNETPAILDSNSFADTFYQVQNLQPAGRFAAFNCMVVLADESNGTVFSDLLAAQNVIDSLSILVDEADSTIMTGTLSSGALASLLSERGAWTAQITAEQAMVDTSASIILYNRHQRYQTALNLNDSIVTSTVYQANVKVMNGGNPADPHERNHVCC